MKNIILLLAVLLPSISFLQATEENQMSENTVVLLETTKGKIKLKLYDEKAPATVKNFIGYVNDGFYNGTIFHRVIDGFMVQGGGFTKDMDQKPTKDPIQNEAANGLSNMRGSVAMARTSDVNSATAQFFINVEDNTFLNHTSKDPHGYGYCVFGHVIDGMDVVDEIKAAKTTNVGPFADVPSEPIEIVSVKIEGK